MEQRVMRRAGSWAALAAALLAGAGCATSTYSGRSVPGDVVIDSAAGCATGTCPSPSAAAAPDFADDGFPPTLDPDAGFVPAAAPRRTAARASSRSNDAAPDYAPVRLDMTAAADPFPNGELLREGDILLGRSYGLVGAAISGSGRTPGPYSHAAMYYRDAEGRGRVINFRPGGMESGPPEVFFSRYSRLALVRTREPMANPHGISVAAREWVERDRRRKIQPDFELDSEDGSALYCLELVSHIYRENNRPDPFSDQTAIAEDQVLDKAKSLFGLPFLMVPSPNSVLDRPDFTVAAEWVRPEYDLRTDAVNEGLVDRIFEYVAAGYTPRDPGFGTRFKVNFALAVRGIGNAFTFWRDHTPLPPYVTKDDIGRGLVMYGHVAKAKKHASNTVKRDTVAEPAGALTDHYDAVDQRVREIARAASDFFRDRYYLPPVGYSAPITPVTAELPNPRRRQPAAPDYRRDLQYGRRSGDVMVQAPARRYEPDRIESAPTPERGFAVRSAPDAAIPEGYYGIVIHDAPAPATVASAVPIDRPEIAAPAAPDAPAEPLLAARSATPKDGEIEIVDPDQPAFYGFVWNTAPLPRPVELADAGTRGPDPLSAMASPGEAASGPVRPLVIASRPTRPVPPVAARELDAARPPMPSAPLVDPIPADAEATAELVLAAANGDDATAGIPGLPTLAVLIGAPPPPPSMPKYDPPALMRRTQLAGVAPEWSTPWEPSKSATPVATLTPPVPADADVQPNPFLTPEENAAARAGKPLPLEDLPALPAGDPNLPPPLYMGGLRIDAPAGHSAMAAPSKGSTTQPVKPSAPEEAREELSPMAAPADPNAPVHPDALSRWDTLDGDDAPQALPLPTAVAPRAVSPIRSVDFLDLLPDWLFTTAQPASRN